MTTSPTSTSAPPSTRASPRISKLKNKRSTAKWRRCGNESPSDGWLLDEQLCFLDDGVSGATLQRPALERLRDAAYVGGLQKLYVHSPDRLARQVRLSSPVGR